MLLDEIRERIKIKKEAIASDPSVSEADKKFLNTMDELFKNRDAILQCPRSVILGTLMYVGYPHADTRPLYDELIEELNKVYKMVDPDDLDQRLGRHK